jgi:RNA polymerase sigma factor (sigma-70 family)
MDELGAYLDELQQAGHPLLSKEEELALALRKEEGDQEAFEALVHSCLRWVVHIARPYFKRNKRVQPVDIIQEGNMGLMRAVEKFAPWKHPYRLTTYSTWWIRQKIQRYVTSERSGIIHMPLDIIDGRREPREEMSQITTEKMLHGGMLSMNYEAFHGLRGDPCTSEFGTLLPQSTEPTEDEIDDWREREDQLYHLHQLIGKLDDRQQIIMRDRLAGGPNNTLDKIGKRLNISRERVRQIEARCRTKIVAAHKNHLVVHDGRIMTMHGDQRDGSRSPAAVMTTPPPSQDPFAVLERITLPQVEAEIAANDKELEDAKARHKNRAAYLKQLRGLVAAREGVGTGNGKPKMKVGAVIAEYLSGKPQQTIDQITAATSLSKQQVSACLRMGSTKFKKDRSDRWSNK